jgi:hypothetical protein
MPGIQRWLSATSAKKSSSPGFIIEKGDIVRSVSLIRSLIIRLSHAQNSSLYENIGLFAEHSGE